MSANAFLVDAQLRHQIMIQRLSGAIWKDVDPVLQRMRDSIVARLASEPTDFQITRLNMLMADVNGMLKASLGKFIWPVSQDGTAVSISAAQLGCEAPAGAV